MLAAVSCSNKGYDLHGVNWQSWARWGIVAGVLLLIMAYIWAGFRQVPFHGDEADHLYKSIDFNVAFVQGQPQDLQATLPIQPDSTEHIRLLTGNVHATLTGYALWSIEIQPQHWPKAWYYAQPVAWNIEQGHWPNATVLERGRIPHVILVMLSVPLAFMIVWYLHPPLRLWSALLAAILLGTHPSWLLSGRRVMQEASLVMLSLLLVLVAMQVARRWHYGWLALVAVLGGLGVAAKPTGAITALAVFLALLLVIGRNGLAWRKITALGFAGVLSVMVYLVLTPAIWGDPPRLIHYMVTERQHILQGQTAASDLAYGTTTQHAAALLEQPFIAPLQYYETPDFADVLMDDIKDYEENRYAGWQKGRVVAWVWTGLAVVGVIHLWRKRAQPPALVMLVWVLVTGTALGISTPLAWQRYYLLWTVAVTLMTAVGFGSIWQWLSGWKSS